MIDYTERITLLMRDLIARVPRLSYIDLAQVLVFARYGRPGAVGPYATCHCLTLPTSEPGYYYWRDRQSGDITRRSRWFVTKTPTVVLCGRPVRYMVSFALPRFCDQSLDGSRKAQHYDGVPGWVAKLDTIAHELYHIDPQAAGIRRVERSDGCAAAGSHGRTFLGTVAGMVKEYLASGPDPDTYDFLRHGFDELNELHGGVVGTTFRNFPSYPQRYIEVLPPSAQPEPPASVRIQPLREPAGPRHFTEADLVTRQFLERATRRVPRRDVRRDWRVVRQIELPDGAEMERAAAGSFEPVRQP